MIRATPTWIAFCLVALALLPLLGGSVADPIPATGPLTTTTLKEGVIPLGQVDQPPVDTPPVPVQVPPTDPVDAPDYMGSPDVPLVSLEISKTGTDSYCFLLTPTGQTPEGTCLPFGRTADPVTSKLPLGVYPVVVPHTDPVPTPPVGGTSPIDVLTVPAIAIDESGDYSLSYKIDAIYDCSELADRASLIVMGQPQTLPLPYGALVDGAAWFAAHGSDTPVVLTFQLLKDGAPFGSPTQVAVPYAGQVYAGQSATACS